MHLVFVCLTMFLLYSSAVHAVCGGLFRTAAVRLLPDASEREYLRAAEEQALSGGLRLQRFLRQSGLRARSRPAASAAAQTETTGEL